MFYELWFGRQPPCVGLLLVFLFLFSFAFLYSFLYTGPCVLCQEAPGKLSAHKILMCLQIHRCFAVSLPSFLLPKRLCYARTYMNVFYSRGLINVICVFALQHYLMESFVLKTKGATLSGGLTHRLILICPSIFFLEAHIPKLLWSIL